MYLFAFDLRETSRATVHTFLILFLLSSLLLLLWENSIKF